MTSTVLPAAFRYIGVTDECVECQKCGKSDLSSTIVLEHVEDGGITYYGSTCAARALAPGQRGAARKLLDEARGVTRVTLRNAAAAAERLAAYDAAGGPESTGAVRLFLTNNPGIARSYANGESWLDGAPIVPADLVADLYAKWNADVAAGRLLGWAPAA